jgi:hypothetical protein
MEWSKRWPDRYLVEGEEGYKSPREALLRYIYIVKDSAGPLAQAPTFSTVQL